MIDWDYKEPIGVDNRNRPMYYKKAGKPVKHKPIYCVELHKWYDTFKEAAEDISGDPKRVALCCRGKIQHHKNLHYVFEDK